MLLRNKKHLLVLALIIVASLVGLQASADVDISKISPLGQIPLTELITRIVRWIIGIVGVLALVMFVYGGLMWMTSAGNMDQVKKGKDTVIWAVAGIALVFFSYSFLSFIIKAITKQ